MLVLAMHILAAGAMTHSPSYTIRRQLRPGERDVYSSKMTMTEDIDGAPGGKKSISAFDDEDQIYCVTKLIPGRDAAAAEVTIRTNKNHVTTPMGSMDVPITRDKRQAGTIDAYNHFSGTGSTQTAASEIAGMPAEQSKNAVGFLIGLPDHPVGVGDSWTIPLSSFKNDKLTVTLVGPGIVHGHPVWHVRLSAHVPFSMDMAQFYASQGKAQPADMAGFLKTSTVNMTGAMDYMGSGVIDQATGKTVLMDYHIDSRMLMTAHHKGGPESMNMKIGSAIALTTTLKGY